MGRRGPLSEIPDKVHRLAKQKDHLLPSGEPNKSQIARSLGISRQRVQDILQLGARPIKSRAQVRRALSERRQNAQAAARGEPLPFAGLFDAWDPTKVPRDASLEEIHRSYLEFCKICRPPKRKKHSL